MTTNSQPLVSVVTPVYNEATYLAQCIESVLAQTYQNWDYTIVDNQSTDGTGEVAEGYARKDPRIRVVRTDRLLPALANHNYALRQISPGSMYCKIVFGDDWLFPECLDRMVSLAEEHPSVGIVSAYTLETDHITLTGLPYECAVMSGRETCRQHVLEQLHLFGSANSLLFRSSFVRKHDPFFNEANVHSDTEACFVVLKESDFGFVHQVLTFSRVRPTSLSADSSDFQTYLAGMLQILMAHGGHYLEPDELQMCLDRHLALYYRFLGKSVLLGRNRKFWEWHKKSMASTGVYFSKGRVMLGLFAEVCDAALNPKQTIERLLNKKKPKSNTPKLTRKFLASA